MAVDGGGLMLLMLMAGQMAGRMDAWLKAGWEGGWQTTWLALVAGCWLLNAWPPLV
jgi:hypothetical protein